ncbi:DedA family protein [Arthrobacter sp. TMN-49]
MHVVGQINNVIDHSAAQWWVIPLVSLFCLIDGFFLFLPSETAIVALASVSAKTGYPNIWLLMLGASIGAIIGDNIAYFLGRKLGTTRFNWMRRPRGARAFAWAGKELEKRGAILIFTARYIPVGRIAVNFTAGATYFPWRRFALLDSIAVVTWAGYSVAVGTFAGGWVHDNPLLGVGIAITFAVVIGFVVDHAMKYLHHVLEKRGKVAPRPEPGLAAAQHAQRVQALAEAQAQLEAHVSEAAEPAEEPAAAPATEPAAAPVAEPATEPATEAETEADIPDTRARAAGHVVQPRVLASRDVTVGAVADASGDGPN